MAEMMSFPVEKTVESLTAWGARAIEQQRRAEEKAADAEKRCRALAKEVTLADKELCRMSSLIGKLQEQAKPKRSGWAALGRIIPYAS